MKTLFVYAVLVVILAGCTTPEIVKDPPPRPQPSPAPQSGLRDLSRSLGLDRPREELGLVERYFRPCQYDSAACAAKFFSVINFRLRCRDSEGTVEAVSRSELQPLFYNRVKWWLGQDSGITETDAEGYGTIFAINPRSVQPSRLAIKIGTVSLGVSASEVRDIVVPRDWCAEVESLSVPY